MENNHTKQPRRPRAVETERVLKIKGFPDLPDPNYSDIEHADVFHEAMETSVEVAEGGDHLTFL